MTSQSGKSQHNWLIRTLFVALATFAVANVLPADARAADLTEQAHSLKKVPADASFYSANLRFAEQWHTFIQSKAYAKLMEIPLFQMAKMQVTYQWQQSEEPTIAKVREYVESPTGKDAVGILKEMFSHEAFMYGGSDVAETISVFMELNSLRRTVPIEAAAEEKDKKEVVTDRIIEILEKHSEKLKVPTIVVGFRIKDQARA